MEYSPIEQLLERYWQCETSLEEEARLRAFFNGDNVPRHLLRYKELFVYQHLQQEEHLGDDFDARVLARVEAPVVKARRLTLRARFMPLLKAAAAVAVLLTLGNLMQHSFFTEERGMTAADTIGNQISTPSVALSADRSTAQEKQLIDSLSQEEVTGQTE